MDPVMARLIDVRPDFDPHAWITQLPPMDLYDALLFQIVGSNFQSADKLRPYSIENRCTSVARITWIR